MMVCAYKQTNELWLQLPTNNIPLYHGVCIITFNKKIVILHINNIVVLMVKP